MTFSLPAILAIGLFLGGDKPNDATKKEIEKLQGTWAVQTVEFDGEKLTEKFITEIKLVVAGDKITVNGNFPEKERYGKFTWKIDPTTMPKVIDLSLSGEEKNVLEGIYQLEKDNWKICLKLNPRNRPDKFATQQGSDTVLVNLKREKS